jgi:CheY-like chemotaxis protein
VADLNAVVRRTGPLLRRLLGEDLAFEFRPAPEPCPVRIDVGSFDQILMNLAVNARDAMPRGGRLAIETASVVLDGDYVRARPEAAEGPHVRVDVSDTGAGMPAEVLAHVFEPFFTTKPVGRGTGLGLSMVQGIVRQAGGHVQVESAPGQGTRFRILLPRADGAARPPSPASEPSASKEEGTETLLLVEDEPAVLDLARRMLSARGYRVLAASSGEAALEIARAEPRIDLVVTDVVMPGMGGPELARRLRELRPGLGVLFASGYPEDAIAHRGVVDPGVNLLQKPYTSAALAQRVRDLLDRR